MVGVPSKMESDKTKIGYLAQQRKLESGQTSINKNQTTSFKRYGREAEKARWKLRHLG
jgi:hypothetical protein